MLTKAIPVRAFCAAIVFGVSALGVATANAASFIVSADISLFTQSIVSSSGSLAGLHVEGFSETSNQQFAEGEAFSEGDGDTTFLFSDGGGTPGSAFYDMTVFSNADGSASIPFGSAVIESTAERTVASVGFLVLENTSATDTYEITYDIFGFLGASVADMSGGISDAAAEAIVEFWVNGSLVDSVSLFADLTFGPPDDFFDVMDDFSITLNPQESVELELRAGASGFASAIIPVPAALPLMSSALLGLVGLARRRATLG
ncbi:MAG: hypothetical protein JSV45_14120 [Chromatiales bacterium]|nr:MAG: hypothetical protein JSV45_14120 [Chromatiales bacterium]